MPKEPTVDTTGDQVGSVPVKRGGPPRHPPPPLAVEPGRTPPWPQPPARTRLPNTPELHAFKVGLQDSRDVWHPHWFRAARAASSALAIYWFSCDSSGIFWACRRNAGKMEGHPLRCLFSDTNKPIFWLLVPRRRLELLQPKRPQRPQRCVSTNSTTSAQRVF